MVYEVLNQPEPMTCVYRAGELAAVNRALDDAGFAAGSAGDLAGQLPYDARWAERIAALLGDQA